jgi:hypothetical protein
VAAILVGERDCRTQFWKRTIQWLFHQSLVLIELLVPDKMVLCEFPKGSYLKQIQQCSHLGQRPQDTILEEDHPMTILSKFGSNWATGSRKEDFQVNCGGHLGRRAEPPDTFLEENHPMTISSKFSSYWANGKRSEMPDTILEGDHPRIISSQFCWDWFSSFWGEYFFLISPPIFSIFCLSTILVGSRDHRAQYWKGATQGPFHHILVAISPVVPDKKVFMWISHRVLC